MKTQTIQFVCRLLQRAAIAILLAGWSRPVAAAPEGPKELVVYFEDFEGGEGGYVVLGKTSWAWGNPTKFPENPRGGERAWATALTGNYGPGENGSIMSPVIDLSRQPVGSSFRLRWYQILVTEPGFDRASVEVSRDGGVTWTRVYGEASGEVARAWTRQSVSLGSEWATPGFRVRFRFRSDESRVDWGFAVDDIELVRVRNDFPEIAFDSGGGHMESDDGTVALDGTIGGFVAVPVGGPAANESVTVLPGFLPMFEVENAIQPPKVVLPVIRRIARMPNGNVLLTFANLQLGTRYQVESSPDLWSGWTREVTTLEAELGTGAAQIEMPLGTGGAQYFRVIQAIE